MADETGGVSGDKGEASSARDRDDSRLDDAKDATEAAMKDTGSDDPERDEVETAALAQEAEDAYSNEVARDSAAMETTRDALRDREVDPMDDPDTLDRAAGNLDAVDTQQQDQADALQAERDLVDEIAAEIQAERDRVVDQMDDPDTLDRAAGQLDDFPATPQARADAANIISENTHKTPEVPFGQRPLDYPDPIGMARDVFDLARTDPNHAADVAEVVNRELVDTPYEAGVFQTEVMERVSTSNVAASVLDSREYGVPRIEADPAQARNVADQILADNFGTSRIGSLFGAEPTLDLEAVADDLIELRGTNQDLAVAAYEDVLDRIGPAKASELEQELATRPHVPGVDLLTPLEPNVFRDTMLGRVAAGMVGDPIAVVTQPFNEHNVAVNPLTDQILSGRQLDDARFMAVIDAASAGVFGSISRLGKGATQSVDEIADIARRGIDDIAAPVADEITDIASPALRRMGRAHNVVENPKWTRTEVLDRRVYQRDDLIDPAFVDPDTGLTNLERMHNGLPPIGPDGEIMNLHHITQTEPGPLVEVTGTFHRDNFRALHQYTNGWDKTWRNGDGAHRQTYNSVPDKIDRAEFDDVREAYWMERALDFGE